MATKWTKKWTAAERAEFVEKFDWVAPLRTMNKYPIPILVKNDFSVDVVHGYLTESDIDAEKLFENGARRLKDGPYHCWGFKTEDEAALFKLKFC
jgi:hypothetical protein